MFFKKLLHYLNPLTLFRKSDANMNTRFMHGINRISILMFLIAFTIVLIRIIKG